MKTPQIFNLTDRITILGMGFVIKGSTEQYVIYGKNQHNQWFEIIYRTEVVWSFKTISVEVNHISKIPRIEHYVNPKIRNPEFELGSVWTSIEHPLFCYCKEKEQLEVNLHQFISRDQYLEYVKSLLCRNMCSFFLLTKKIRW